MRRIVITNLVPTIPSVGGFLHAATGPDANSWIRIQNGIAYAA